MDLPLNPPVRPGDKVKVTGAKTGHDGMTGYVAYVDNLRAIARVQRQPYVEGQNRWFGTCDIPIASLTILDPNVPDPIRVRRAAMPTKYVEIKTTDGQPTTQPLSEFRAAMTLTGATLFGSNKSAARWVSSLVKTESATLMLGAEVIEYRIVER